MLNRKDIQHLNEVEKKKKSFKRKRREGTVGHQFLAFPRASLHVLSLLTLSCPSVLPKLSCGVGQVLQQCQPSELNQALLAALAWGHRFQWELLGAQQD